MIEFMYPSIPGAKYTPTHSGACEIAGFSINEIREGKAQTKNCVMQVPVLLLNVI